MRVRNLLIENRSLFMDTLEKELCKYGISYVRIDNEIHFLNEIIRFYDMEIDKRYIIAWFFAKEMKEQEMKMPTLLKIDVNSLSKEKLMNYIPVDTYNDVEKYYPTRNHKIQKQESHKVKQQLKRYSK